MLARVREVIVPPAPEYEKKSSSSLISLISSNEVELSVVVSPDVTDEACKVPTLTNDYVSVALDMGVREKRSDRERRRRVREFSGFVS